ncbi:MAG: hypothetical protein RPR97_11380, partial [Colwellia sp.]
SAVAAALARVKAKKEQNKENESQIPSGDEKSQVKAAIARAKAKRLAKSNTNNKEINELQVTGNEKSNKKVDESHVSNFEQNNNAKDKPPVIYNEKAQKENPLINSAAIDRKVRIAAAVAKAKAKVKAKKQQEKLAVINNEEQNQPNDSRPDNPKPNSETK